MSDVWEKIRAPFAFDQVEVMPKQLNDGKALALVYLDARAVMDRLDDVFGPEGWKAEYREVHVPSSFGVFCKLSVRVMPEWVVREDGCETSDIEAFKGAISGSLKRAFSALGNRYLYSIDMGWQPCETREKNGKQVFKCWTPAARTAMLKSYNQQVEALFKIKMPKVALKEEPQNLEQDARDFLKSLNLPESDLKVFKQNAHNKGMDLTTATLLAKSEGVMSGEQLHEFIQGVVKK